MDWALELDVGVVSSSMLALWEEGTEVEALVSCKLVLEFYMD
jgi:hypothetical protein